MLVGYARVSKYDQNLELQINALTKVGCEKIFSDKTSGSRMERQGLNDAFSHLREQDVFVVWKLDRLGRNVRGIIDFICEIEKRGVHFKSLTDNIDTTTAAGRFFFHVMTSLAQMERELIIERTRAGLEAARKRGRIGGRKRLMTPSKVESAKKLLKSGLPPREVAKNLGVSIPTLYRWCPANNRL
ncbi:MAG: recombinase family protein [Proteobacteria bacterium]|nr:recombinase family protein [Pseudomonadota bacterium]